MQARDFFGSLTATAFEAPVAARTRERESIVTGIDARIAFTFIAGAIIIQW